MSRASKALTAARKEIKKHNPLFGGGYLQVARHMIEFGIICEQKIESKTDGRRVILQWAKENGISLVLVRRKNKKTVKKQSYSDQSKEFLSSWEWRTLRYEILLKHGRRCMCCGATPDDGVTVICVDHIKPRHKFPSLSLDPDNLQVLCGVCNQGKGAWDSTDFRDNVIEYDFQCKLASEAKDCQ